MSAGDSGVMAAGDVFERLCFQCNDIKRFCCTHCVGPFLSLVEDVRRVASLHLDSELPGKVNTTDNREDECVIQPVAIICTFPTW